MLMPSAAATAYFNPRPPRGGRPRHIGIALQLQEFQSTPSARRATARNLDAPEQHIISIHALREEGDEEERISFEDHELFQSTPSARRATARGAMACAAVLGISIHALREEGDCPP